MRATAFKITAHRQLAVAHPGTPSVMDGADLIRPTSTFHLKQHLEQAYTPPNSPRGFRWQNVNHAVFPEVRDQVIKSSRDHLGSGSRAVIRSSNCEENDEQLLHFERNNCDDEATCSDRK